MQLPAWTKRSKGYVTAINRNFKQPLKEPATPVSAGRTFSQLVTLDEIISVRHNPRHPDGARNSLDALVQGFEADKGKIVDSYFSRRIPAAAILTENDEIHIKYPPEVIASLTPEFEHSIWSCISLSREAKEVLQGKHLRTVINVLHSLVVYLLTVLDSQACRTISNARVADASAEKNLVGDEALKFQGSDERIQAALSTANTELERARNHIDSFATREAGKFYLLGMLFAIALLMAFALTLGNVNMKDWDAQSLLIALVAGGLGAIVSVMARTMNTDQLKVDYHAGKLMISIGGFFRPLVGAVFGLVFYALIGSKLLPMALPSVTAPEAPSSKEQTLLFFATIAFLAGFSERLAQDTLVRTAGGFFSQGNDGSSKSELVSVKPNPTGKSPDNSNQV
jgi:hypothetical protein